MSKVEVQGDVTGQLAGGDIHNYGPVIIQTVSGKTKVKVVIQPGPEHIEEKKAATLKFHVQEIVRLEKLLRRSPKGFAAVWNALNTKCRVTSYHLILDTDYPKAEKFLREWIGRLSSAKSAPAKDPNWRNRKFSYIFTNIKQLGAEEALRGHLRERHGSSSLKGISDDNLESIYRLVAGWKKAGLPPSRRMPDSGPPQGVEGLAPTAGTEHTESGN